LSRIQILVLKLSHKHTHIPERILDLV